MKLKTKLVWTFSLISIVAMIILAIVLTVNTRNFLIKEIDEGELVLVQNKASQIKQALDGTITDLKTISRYPPIQGIIRAQANNGLDPVDQSTIVQWEQRLTTLFEGFLYNRPYATQVRYIDVSGQELVRVNLENNKTVQVSKDKLQNKASRFYFQQIVQLEPEEVYVSRVTLNQEFSQIILSDAPIFRVGLPIYADNGTRYGILVVNIEARPFFEKLVIQDSRHKFIVTNQDGNFLIHPDSNLALKYLYDPTVKPYFYNQPELKDNLARYDELKFHDHQEEEIRTWQKIFFNPADLSEYWVFYSVIDEAILFEPIQKLFNFTIGLIAFFVLVILVITSSVSRQIASALVYLTQKASKISRGERELVIDIQSGTDEITSLSRTLQTMLQNLKDSEESLLKKTSALAETNKELERFVYAASHDLQAPLRKIMMFIDLMEDDLQGKLNDQSKDIMNKIHKSADSMSRMVHDLLEYSFLGIQDFDPERVDLNVLLHDVVSEFSQLSNANCKIDHLPEVPGYSVLLKQLFRHLLANTIKFSKGEALEVEIAVADMDNHWQFSVKDNGIGFEQQHGQQIFLVFKRLHHQHEISGSGIGLALCRRVVKEHGGDIWVESEPGVGSTFYFTISKEITQEVS